MKKLRWTAFALALLMALMLAACGSDSTGGVAGSGEMDADQYFNDWIGAEPTTFDSANASDTYAMYLIADTMEPLIRLEEQEDGTLKEAFAGAESYEMSEDGLTWTFKLRDNKWSDGQPVTAQDYAYGITRVLDPDVGAYFSYIHLHIKNASAVNAGELPVEELGVKALDDKTLEITLEYPTSYFRNMLNNVTMMPVRQDIVEQYGDQYGTEADKTISCGPFMVESWVHNSEVVLVPNPEYWDAGNVKLQKYTYKVLPDENAAYSSLENGSIDNCEVRTKEWVDNFAANDALTHARVGRSMVTYQYFNQTYELFSNEKVRKAFTLAIDREEMCEVVYDGLREPAYSMIPDGVMVEDTEYLSVGNQPIKALIDQNLDPKALLVEGLTELGMDPDPANLTVEYSFGGTDSFTKTVGEYLQQKYKEVLGVNIEIKMQDWGAFMNDFYNYDYQMGQMSYGAEFNDPLSMLQAFESSQDYYVIGWGNEEVDQLLIDATSEFDTEKKIELIERMEEIIMTENACVSPQTLYYIDYFTYDYVKDYSYNVYSISDMHKYVYTSGRSA